VREVRSSLITDEDFDDLLAWTVRQNFNAAASFPFQVPLEDFEIARLRMKS